MPDADFDLVTANLDGRQPAEEQIGAVKVYRLGTGRSAKYLFPWLAAAWAKQRQTERPYHLIWAIMANQAGMAAARFKKSFPDLPFLLTLQEGDEVDGWLYRLRLLGPRLFGVFRCADAIVAISHYLADWARRRGAVCPVTVIPNGVDLKKFEIPASPSGRRNPKSEINPKSKNQKQKSKILITTSRLVRKNGVSDLLEALRFLPPEVKLRIVGTGPLESKLKLITKTYHLEPRIEFLGQAPPEKIPELLAEADIFVRPSRSEGLGNSFLEAMAAGLPVIGTPVGGIPDFLYGESGRTVGKDQTGFFCRVGDPRSIAEQVKWILHPAHAAAVARVREQARHLVAERYQWPRLAGGYQQIFYQLLTGEALSMAADFPTENQALVAPSVAAARRELNLRGQVILSAGRLVSWKGFELLIDLMGGLTRRYPAARLYLAGDGPERAELQKQIESRNLSEQVFLLGDLSPELLATWIRAANLFVLNSAYEGRSALLRQVLALKTPIITTPVGGNRELIVNGKNGILVPYNDPVAWLKAIERLLDQ